MDAARHFRARLYKSFGLEPPHTRHRSSDFRQPKVPLQALLIDGGRHAMGEFFEAAAHLSKVHGITFKRISWANHTGMQSGADFFREHLQFLSQTDIHISGPGTTLMYQQLLQDGSVVVNLGAGDAESGKLINFGDEYMAEGAPYLRALYALRKTPKRAGRTGYTKAEGKHVAELALFAKKLIQDGFSIPTEPGSNLSPHAAVVKAYAHLSVGDCSTPVDPLMPLRGYIYEWTNMTLKDENLGAQKTQNFARLPKSNAQHQRLWAALRQGYNDWAHFDWFDSADL
eukprot:gnl/TRDRNA2_/TRDRNA2_143213_c1_seq4.p1 gnl/TRDRNA2_/TRDRNA2_143213_c1~~gnl/TRDRNA2_/TRDRNA2_143213_c1_seq4.p1  ORF type:complete len:305 (+),score=32.21 gnl/TRDRNA2_/TRDRNA2_143213_c1_seq4:62-916(+)